jgi:hypothetical protein
MEAHLLIHKARILKFEPLKTHISQALAESRTQEDTANWEQALTLVQALIDPCPECNLMVCGCNGTLNELALLQKAVTDPPICCTSDNMCEGHRAKMAPDLLDKIDAASSKEEKDKIIGDYIADAYRRGEWSLP